MDRKRKFTFKFIAGCVAVAIAICVATASGMISLIHWYLSNCGESAACSASDWLISYWWTLFVPGCLAIAYLLRRLYDRRIERIDRDLET